MKKKKKTDRIALRGFLRIQKIDKKTRQVIGDSGWLQNQITNYGLNSCFVPCPIGASSIQAAGLMLGSGGSDPNATDTALLSKNTDYYAAFDYSSVIGSLTARMSCSFDGTLGAATLNNIGIFGHSTGSLLAGKTFTSSALSTDQDVNCSYEIRYATS